MASGLGVVKERIASAAARAGRDPETITLVAVSKARTVDQIQSLYDEGQRAFGENRADELVAKAPLLPPDIVWHFVGTIQRRRASQIAQHATLIHSLDRLSLARRWASFGPGAPRSLLQVNIGRETQKHGVDPDAVASSLVEYAEFGLHPVGLMAIPPAPDRPEDSRPYFQQMAALRDRLIAEHPALSILSMGMTDDFEVAVEEGATLVRVGRAIFGDETAVPTGG